MSKTVACPENQAAFNHLSLVASRCLGGKREQYRFSLLKAMKSLKLYPLPIESIEEALSLDGIGPALAKELMKGVAISKSGNIIQEKQTPFDNSCNGEVLEKAKSSKLERSALGLLGASPLPKRPKPCHSDLSFLVAMKKNSQSEVSIATDIFDSPREDVPTGDIMYVSDNFSHTKGKDQNMRSSPMKRSEDLPSSSPEKVWNLIQDATRCNKSKSDSTRTICAKSKKYSLRLEIPESPCMIRPSCSNDSGLDVCSIIKNNSEKAELNRDEHQHRNIQNDTIISFIRNNTKSSINSIITEVSNCNQCYDLTQDDCESNDLKGFQSVPYEINAKRIDIQNYLCNMNSNKSIGCRNNNTKVGGIDDKNTCQRYNRDMQDRENIEENKMDNYQHCADRDDFDGIRTLGRNGGGHDGELVSDNNEYDNYGNSNRKSKILDCKNTHQSYNSQTFGNDDSNCKDNNSEDNNFDGDEYDCNGYDDYDNSNDVYTYHNFNNSNNDNDNSKNDNNICNRSIEKNGNNIDIVNRCNSDDDDSSIDMNFSMKGKRNNINNKKIADKMNKINKITESVRVQISDKKEEEEAKKKVKKGKSEYLKIHVTGKHEHTVDRDDNSKIVSTGNDHIKFRKIRQKEEHNNSKISNQEENEVIEVEKFYRKQGLPKELSSTMIYSEDPRDFKSGHSGEFTHQDYLYHETYRKEGQEIEQRNGEREKQRQREVLQIDDTDDEDESRKEYLLEQLKGRRKEGNTKKILAQEESNQFLTFELNSSNFTEGRTKQYEKVKIKDIIIAKKKDSIKEKAKKKTSSLSPSTCNASLTEVSIETEIENERGMGIELETVINNTDDTPIKKFKKSINSPIGLKIRPDSNDIKIVPVPMKSKKIDLNLTVGELLSSSQALSKFDKSVKKNKDNDENIYGNINIDSKSKTPSIMKESSFKDQFCIDSSDEEEAENMPDSDDITIENSPIIDPFLAPLLGDINDWEPVLMVDVREKDHNLIQVNNEKQLKFFYYTLML